MRKIKKQLIRVISLIGATSLLAGFVVPNFEPRNTQANVAVQSNPIQSNIIKTNASIKTNQEDFYDPNVVYQLPAEITDDQILSVIVNMDRESVMDSYDRAGSGQTLTEYINSKKGKSVANEIETAQNQLLSKLKKSGIQYTVGEKYDTIFSGFEINIKAKDFDAVGELFSDNATLIIGDEYEKSEYTVVTNDVEVYETGIFDSSSSKYQGDGVVVAVLDTGLDYTHSAFSVDNFTTTKEAFTLSNVSQKVANTAAARFTSGLQGEDVYLNKKVPYAYDYADKDSDVLPINSEHGTHVAGIIAGNDDQITGVAPNAQLAIMKVFSDLQDGAKDSWVLAAVEDCVTLGVDVINMSLGSSCGFTREVDKEEKNFFYDKVREAGISLIAAASNDSNATSASDKNGSNPLTSNPDSGTIGSPATYSASLSVASVDGVKTPYLVYNDQIIYFTEASTTDATKKKSFVDEILSTLGDDVQSHDFEYVTIPGIGRSSDYPQESDFYAGKIVLVKRGTTTFEDKVRVALKEKGAAGIIIYNNVSGRISMAVGEDVGAVCSISQDEGEKLAASETGIIRISKQQKAGPFMSDFSSWGPTSDLKIKPEITAHGGEIYSAVPGQEYNRLSGTSMAAPNQAGATALIRQYVRYSGEFGSFSEELTKEEAQKVTALVNQIVMSTADIVYNKNGLAYSVRKQGAGLVNISKATDVDAYLTTYENGEVMDKTKLELGDDKDETGVYDNIKFSINNISGSSLSYDIGAIVMTEGVSPTYTSHDDTTSTQEGYLLEGATITVNTVDGVAANGNQVTVPAGKSVVVTATVTLSDADKKYIEDSFEYGMYVEGFVTLTPVSGTKYNLNVPMLAFYGDWTEAPIFDEEYYDTNKDEINAGLDVEDKLMADAYATRVIGSLYADYISVLGTYYFIQDPTATQIAADKDRIALSNQKSTTNYTLNGIRSIWAGMLRNAKEVDMKIVEDVTGEVIFEKTGYNQRKSYSQGLTLYQSSIEVDFDVLEHKLKNNTKYTVTVETYIDYGTKEGQNNARNVFEFPLYIDFESPVITDVAYRTEYDATTKKTKLFADVSVYDNHYAMGMQFGQILPADYEKTGYYFTMDTFGKYVTPIYSSRNSVSTVTVELTDYLSRIKQSAGVGYNENNEFYVDENNNSFLIVCYDYAMNAATYEIRLPDEILAMNFTEDTIKINPNQTFDLSTVLNVFPEESWLQVLDFTVDEKDKEIVDVVNQTVLAKKSGDATITAIGYDHSGNMVSDTIVIHVLAQGEEGYDGSYTIPQVNKFSVTGYKTEKAFYAINNSDRDIGLAGENRSFGDSLSLSMFPSESVTLSYILDSYYPDRTTVTYKAGNSKIATVNENGTIVAQAEGNTTITVNVQFDGKSTLYSARINVAVKDPFTTSSIYLMNYRGLGGEVVIPDDRGLTMIYQYAFSNYEYIAKDLDAGDVINEEDPYSTKPWFIGESTITKVVIPEGITHINMYAFANLTALEEVVMPTTLKTIGVGAFYGCSSLKKINLEHVKFINANAFNDCGLEEVNLDSVVAIGNNAFANCKLNYVELPQSSQSLGEGAFANNKTLSSVSFDAPKIKIGERAFYGCERLTTMDINAAVISSYAFYNCKNLNNVTLGKDVAVIGEYAFMGTNVASFKLARGSILGSEANGALIYSDASLTKLLVVAPQYAGNAVNTVVTSAKEIGTGAFAGNKKIRYIEANEATNIGAYAFAGCAQLRNVSLDKVVEISDYAFMNTPITETPNLTAIATIGRYAFAQTKIESVVVPDGAVIEDSAFVNCSQLESVTIGNGVVIGDYAFQTTLSLQIFEFGRTQEAQMERLNQYYNDTYSYVVYDDEGNVLESMTYRRYDRFEQDCTSKLKTVTIGEMVTVGAHAFEGNTKLTTLAVGAGTTIGDYAFYNAASLENVDLSQVVSIGDYAFSGDNILEFSLSNVGWALAYEKAYIDGEVKVLDYKYMSLAPVIKTVDLSNATYIGKGAFAYNRALENIVFAESAAEGSALTTISDYAFCDCEALQALNLPSYVTEIGAYAFYGSKLQQIDARNVTVVGDYAFAFNTLKKISLKENASIGDYAFYYNFYLTEIENLDTVTEIGAYAFAETKITEVALTKVSHVGDFAFSNSKLNKVTFGEQLVSLGENPFYGCDIETFAREKDLIFNGQVLGKESEETYDISATVKVVNDTLYQVLPNGAYELVSYPSKKAEKNVDIMDGTVRISAKAFAGTALESVTLPASLKAIGDKAFYQCDNLSVVIFKSYEAPILEEEYDTAHLTIDNLPFTGKTEVYQGVVVEGLGISKYYMWNAASSLNNFYFGANFVDYIGHVENKIVMVKPANGQGYDSFILAQYFSTFVEGSNAAMDRTLEVIAMIAGLPANITLNDEAAVVAVREAYDGIPSLEQKALVSNYSVLENAESMITYLKLRDEQSNGSVDSSVKDSDEKKGCGGCNSVVGSGLGALTLLAVGFAMVKGKGSKEDFEDKE